MRTFLAWQRASRAPLAAALLVVGAACADPTTSAVSSAPESAPVFNGGAGALAVTTNILNPSGGTNANDGLKIWTSNGAYQIQREGVSQIFSASKFPANLQFALYSEGRLLSWEPAGNNIWTVFGLIPVDVWTQSASTLTETDPGKTWQNVETLTGTTSGKSYTAVITTTYTTPDPFAQVGISITLPDGLTAKPQLYLASDFNLAGSDNGPGKTDLIDGKRYVVQYQGSEASPTAVGGLLEVDPFTSWVEDFYTCVYGAGPAAFCNASGAPFGPSQGTPFPNTVNGNSVDAGVGAHWDLGVTSGTVSRTVKLYFASKLPGPNAETITVTADDKTVTFGSAAPTYTYTLTDGEDNEWTPPAGWTAPTCESDPTYTTSTAVGTAIDIVCSGASADGFEFEYVDGTLTVEKATPTLTWTGTTGLVTGSTVTLSATVSPAACTGPVTYTVNGTSATSPYTVPPGGEIVEIVATYGGNSNCAGTSVTEIVVAAVAGGATTGGGVYRVFNDGSQRINFGHTVQRSETTNKRTGTTTTVYRGQLLWMVTEQWRFKGRVYSSTTTGPGVAATGDAPAFVTFPCPTSSPAVGTSGSSPKCGMFTGTGVLQQWNSMWMRWENVGGERTFAATIYDGGQLKTCKGKNNCTTSLLTDFFGLALSGEVPEGVPVSNPQPLQKSQNGNIVIR